MMASLLSGKNVLRAAAVGAAVVATGGILAAPAIGKPSAATPSHLARVSAAPRLPSGARVTSAVSTSRSISGAVALAPRDPAALAQAAAAASNPKSPSYQHYLAKGAFAKTYGPSAATISATKSALAASHLTVTSVSSNGLLVHFKGSVGAAESAFHTRLANVRTASGVTGTETTTAVSLPASVASQVTSVVGLDTLVRPATSIEHATHPATVKAKAPASLTHSPGAPDACAAASGTAAEFGGLTDDQIAHAYGVDGLYSKGDLGAGQSIAVYELEPFSTTDLAAFDTCYYGKTAAAAMASRLTVSNVDGGAGTGEGSGESILDVDDVSGLAPGANIDVYEAPNTASASIDEYNAIITADTDQEITTSWAYCEADEQQLEPGYTNVENALFEQAAVQGQSLYASAGDAGSDACAYHATTPTSPTLSESDPASQPFVTAVGGTSITDADNPPTEQPWNDGSQWGGAGGGVSAIWSAPSWQQAALTPAEKAIAESAATTGGQTQCAQSAEGLCREVPDVSGEADEFTGAITVYAAEFDGWTTFGGTSSSTPLWAAMMADINASAGCAAGSGIGFASPALYDVASSPTAYAASFNDVTAGNNDIYDLSGGKFFSAGTGYDMASGLGTPRVVGASGQAGLASYLCALSAPATPAPSVTSLAPATVSTAGGGSLVLTGANLAGVTAASVGGYAVPTADVTATSTSVTISPIPSAAQADTAGLGPQDGSGRAIVSLTDGATGQGSVASPATSLLYVDGTPATSDVPSVSGTLQYGGADAGGNTVSIFGSDFASGDTVTVGGVAATGVTVLSPTKLTAVIPAYHSGTTGCATGNDAAIDVCQAQVVVTNGHGHSAGATILPPYSGAYFIGLQLDETPPACVAAATCEITPATTEYDYLATPTISSITTTFAGDGKAWASEQGTTIATITGTGFDYLGFNYVNIGTPTVAANADFGFISVTPTEIQVTLTGRDPSVEPETKQVTVQTLQGLSAPSPVTFAGIPTVSQVAPFAVPSTGGSALAVTGQGFEGTTTAEGGDLDYSGIGIVPTDTVQLSGYAATSDTSLAVSSTPQNNPGAYLLTVCTVSGCSSPVTDADFENTLVDFYMPGNAVVTGVSTVSGPASGGTQVVISGRNLSDAVEVKFGNVVAAAANEPQLLTGGSSTAIDAVVPPGKAGTTVPVTVVTVESLSGGSTSSTATFHYTTSVPSAAQEVTATKIHHATLRVHWKAPASNGGHKVTAYRVSAVSIAQSTKKGAAKPPTVAVRIGRGSARAATLSGLRPGWTYTIKVQAINAKGRGLPGFDPKLYAIRDPA